VRTNQDDVIDWLRSPEGTVWSNMKHSRENKSMLMHVIIPGYLSCGDERDPENYVAELQIIPLWWVGKGLD
jgi:hypothetical protein